MARHKLAPGEAQRNKHYTTYKWCAKDRNLEFSLNIDEFDALTKQNCHYCGQQPVPRIDKSTKRYNGPFIGNGIDRMDSTRGYTLNNCVPCCFACNYAKHTRTYEDYKAWIVRSYNHLILGEGPNYR